MMKSITPLNLRQPMKQLAVACAIASLLVTAGCGKTLKPEAKKPVKLVEVTAPQATLQPIFSVAVEDSRLKRGEKLSKKDLLDLQIGTDGNTMVLASKTGTVGGYVGNQKAWSVSVGEPIVSGVGFDGNSGTAIVSTRSGKVIALDAETGAARWTQDLKATVLTPAVIAGNRVLLSANNGILHGLNLQSGAPIWQFSTQSPNVSVRGAAKPLRLDGSTALFGTADGRIHAINSDSGSPLWTRRIGVAIGGSDVGRMSDVDGTPLVVGNYLYVTSYSGSLSGFDMSTGQVLFTVRDFPSTHPVAFVGGVLMGADTDGMVYGFDPMTGERLWQNNALTHRKPSAPVTVGDYVAFGDYEGYVHLFTKDGNLVARTQAKDKGQIVSLQARQNRLYAQTTTGQAVVWQVQ